MSSEIHLKPYALFKNGERALALVTKAGERAAGKNAIGDDKYVPYAIGDLALLDTTTGMVITGPVGVNTIFNMSNAVLNGEPYALTDSHVVRALALYAMFKLGAPVVPEPKETPAPSAEVHQAQDEIRTSFGDGTEG